MRSRFSNESWGFVSAGEKLSHFGRGKPGPRTRGGGNRILRRRPTAMLRRSGGTEQRF